MSQPYPIFGLTGGIACGKSTVARIFQDLGACIIDADRIGHELIEAGRAAYQEIVQLFGNEILAGDGSIDRGKLGTRVFTHPKEMHALNAALHPRIITRVEELARESRARHPHGVIIVDAALVFESGLEGTLRKVIVVWCRPEQQLERLMSKAGLSREQAEQRIGSQMPPEEKRCRADYVIDCSGSKERARQQAEAIYPELERIVAAQ
jgi:dephospho-CoA kinase